MRVGIGLPVIAPDAVLQWARLIDEGDFSTVTISDRLAYETPDPLVALAGVAGATSRVGIRTQVLLAALRDPVLLAKQVATLDRLSRGRFSLGIGLGDRPADYGAAGVPLSVRGRRLDANVERMLELLRAANTGAERPSCVRTTSPTGPELLFGGFSDAAVARVARYGDGYMSAMVPELSGYIFEEVRKAWRQTGREGDPRMVAQANVVVGPDSLIEETKALVTSYYSFLDDSEAPFTGAMVAENMLTTPERLRTAVKMCGDFGADEIVFVCWASDPAQVARIGDALG